MKTFASRMKNKIQKELSKVNEEIAELKREPLPQELEGGGDNTPLSEEGDVMQVIEEREVRSEVLGRLIERAEALDEALHRVRDGTYGVCVRCDARIPHKRLEAVPEAALCAACQEATDSTKPVKEPRPTEWKSVEGIYREREKEPS